MLNEIKSKLAYVAGAVATLPAVAMAAGNAELKTGVTNGAADYMANITDNVPAILGVVALVAAVLLIIRLFRR
ncbi:hypothetical protein ETQ85_00445 [Zoogloea oleivorans]|uniref:Methyltransferase n=1 Tax=Zoogloea oleivorans TaxID=1552750 RepID=A0A6C2D8Q5_9RHOO|nr:hypothetical protein [Zoogloea oleivorans]TYC62065.1 hypothetical protein ETQ85_00445 [Zoogloea oleivorans]